METLLGIILIIICGFIGWYFDDIIRIIKKVYNAIRK